MTRIEGPSPTRATRAYRRIQTAGSVASAPNAGADVEATQTGVAATSPAELPPQMRDSFAVLVSDADELRSTLALARARIEELEKLVETDDLTPIANRRGLLRDLGRTLADVDRHRLAAAMIYIDVNRLKAINDTHGHLAGDAVIKHVAETLRASLRESDTVARMSGDEFAVILRHVDAEQARAKTLQIMAAVAARPAVLRGTEIEVSVSAGFHVLVPGETRDSVLAGADRAMYGCKSGVRQGLRRTTKDCHSNGVGGPVESR